MFYWRRLLLLLFYFQCFTSVHVIFTTNSKRCCAFSKLHVVFNRSGKRTKYRVNELLALMRIWWIGLLLWELIVWRIHTCLSADNEKDVNELSFFIHTLLLFHRCLDINLLTLYLLRLRSFLLPVRISFNYSRCFLITSYDPLIFLWQESKSSLVKKCLLKKTTTTLLGVSFWGNHANSSKLFGRL